MGDHVPRSAARCVAWCKEQRRAVDGSAPPLEGTDTSVTGTVSDDSRLPRTIYRVTSRLDNASLRVLDAGVILVAWLLAFLAGFEGGLPRNVVGGPLLLLALPLVTQLVANQLAGLYGPIWRYASVEEGARVIFAVAGGVAVSALELVALDKVSDGSLPIYTAPPIAAMLVLLGCGGIRFQARLFALERQRAAKSDDRLRTLIVGSGNAGAALARELTSGTHSDTKVVGFVDDDPDLRGRSVRGVPVLGNTDDIERIVEAYAIDRVLIALPNARREEIQAIVARALRTEAQVKVLPRTTDLISGPLLRSLRDLDLADLLGREHAPVDPVEISDYLEGATVLVTGAGGSIGSEIARQVARFRPGRLLLLDRDESLLHETVSDDLAAAEPVLADIRDRPRLRSIFERYRPHVVFHAAAHKHVPILERHPVEAAHTNLLGTWWLARTAAEFGCGRFVHVSTDKAANPCSVMGATKRAAELVVFQVGSEYKLPYAAVRFGNVLGSRGSVVPTFLRQILDGGPVTVTDPEMTRYFMTIPEAVSLVLQAGAMADEGKVFLLDMGKPVSIIDLARQMIRLSGLRPDEDVSIEITGTRPGERLHEQLHDDAETVEPTRHPSIWGVQPKSTPDPATLFFFLELLDSKCAETSAESAVASLLAQLLRRCGVSCQLALEDPSDEEVEMDTEPPHARAFGPPAGRRRPEGGRTDGRAAKVPALLGGPPYFSQPLAFARPARPPLEAVWRRLKPSYDCGMLTNGPLVAELEDRIAERLGVPHVVAVSSCTSGLMLTLQALTEGRPGPVVLPSFTFSASGHAVLWNGRVPQFVECDPLTFQIDVDHTADYLDGAAALMATHVFGAPCDPDSVVKVGQARGVPVVFDAAHALGAKSDGQPIGGFGDAEVFSLTPTKVLVAGEGGLVATRDASLAKSLRIGRDYGNPGDYDTRFAGLNARMSEFHAAMALESLELLEETLERRRKLAALYRELVDEVPGVRCQEVHGTDLSTYKDFTITVDDEFGLRRDDLVAFLAAEGIETRNYFDPPVHRQQAYAGVERPDLPITDAVASSVVSLPIYHDLGEDDVVRIVDAIAGAHVHAAEIDNAHVTSGPRASSRLPR
jgi:FlaA1/EpsC-like NDP-sugar epimerase/dTDP-4-amino-4,6-dideoxygalactose transaminase